MSYSIYLKKMDIIMREEALVTHLRQYLPQADEKRALVMFR